MQLNYSTCIAGENSGEIGIILRYTVLQLFSERVYAHFILFADPQSLLPTPPLSPSLR